MSSLAKESIETKLQVSHVCNKCFGSVTNEESYPILTVPMAPTVGEAIGLVWFGLQATPRAESAKSTLQSYVLIQLL